MILMMLMMMFDNNVDDNRDVLEKDNVDDDDMG